MIASFYDLKSMIVRTCTAKSDAKDYAGKHSFTIDMHALDNMCVQKGLDYHVMAGAGILESYVPYVSDIHTISDYVESYKVLNEIMDGYTQIVIFSLYSTRDKNGEIIIGDDDDHKYDAKELFTACNNKKKLDVDLMCMIAKQLPSYKILVARKFNPNTDSFVYEIFFRSNKSMSAYYRSASDKAKKEAAKTTEAESEEKE